MRLDHPPTGQVVGVREGERDRPLRRRRGARRPRRRTRPPGRRPAPRTTSTPAPAGRVRAGSGRRLAGPPRTARRLGVVGSQVEQRTAGEQEVDGLVGVVGDHRVGDAEHHRGVGHAARGESSRPRAARGSACGCRRGRRPPLGRRGRRPVGGTTPRASHAPPRRRCGRGRPGRGHSTSRRRPASRSRSACSARCRSPGRASCARVTRSCRGRPGQPHLVEARAGSPPPGPARRRGWPPASRARAGSRKRGPGRRREPRRSRDSAAGPDGQAAAEVDVVVRGPRRRQVEGLPAACRSTRISRQRASSICPSREVIGQHVDVLAVAGRSGASG